MRFISKQDPISVYAKMGSKRIQKFEDYAQIMLTYENGETAFIESNWLTPYKTRTLTATGTEAIMQLDYNTQELLDRRKNPNSTTTPAIPRTTQSRATALR